MISVFDPQERPARHALVVVAAFAVIFIWLFARPIVEHAYLVESDLGDSYLPRFLSTFFPWSSYEFAGYLIAADSDDVPFYPLRFLFGPILGSWTGFVVSAYVLAASATYAYVFSATRSRLAAAFAGLAYGLSEAMMERVAHINIVHAIAWLPVILLSVDRLRGPHSRRWIAIGAFAAGCTFLLGHPQIGLYSCAAAAVYALVGGLAERERPRYYVAVSALFVLGALLSAVKLLPQFDIMQQMARQQMSFEQFVGHANSPAQMLSMLFPAVEHEGREAPTYVGLVTLVLATLSVAHARRNWRVAFWLTVAVAAFMLGAGDSTPLAGFVFEIPLYDRFRVVGRHLFLASFGSAVLAGTAVAALQRRALPLKAVLGAVAVVGTAVAAAGISVAVDPARYGLVDSGPVATHAVVAIVATAACLAFALRPGSRAWSAVLLGVLVVDLVLALPYTVHLTGLEAPVMPQSGAEPSVHVTRLKTGLAPLGQRLLSPMGAGADELVPAGYGRLWAIPLLGGYSQLLPARLSALATMGPNGAVTPAVFDDNPTLDLLAVKYVVMQASDLGSAGDTFERHDVTWAVEPLRLPIGEPECGQQHPRSASYALPVGTSTASVHIALHLGCSEDARQGHPVGTLRILSSGMAPLERPLRAGVEVADQGLSDPTLARRARHSQAVAFDPDTAPLTYYLRVDLPQPMPDARIEIESSSSGWIEIDRITVVDAEGGQFPQRMPAFALGDPQRWLSLPPFFTSQATDRSHDETAAGERQYALFENRRALPRAWITEEVIPLSEERQLRAAHYSYLPDGQRFDPARLAMVEEGTLERTAWRGGSASARVTDIRDGFFSIDVETLDGGFLVLSEGWYPSWQARLDGQPLPIQRVDVSLMGVVVPGGNHIVTFEFVSRPFQAGAAISLLTLVALASMAWRRTRQAPPPEHGTRS
ncbi:MAG: YfhO family protein [Acidobacteria bacterium]|nr:YfhO family protein [Acidobacteriota bacterium]